MDKNIYVFGSSLMHSKKGEEVAGHKYIKREYKNGRWTYEYKDESPSGKAYEQYKNQVENAKRISKQYDDEIKPDNYYEIKEYNSDMIKPVQDAYKEYYDSLEALKHIKEQLSDWHWMMEMGNTKYKSTDLTKNDYPQLMVNYKFAARRVENASKNLSNEFNKYYKDFDFSSGNKYDVLQRLINYTLDRQNSNSVNVSVESSNKKK